MDNLRNCKICGRELDTTAKICPSCGAQNPIPIYKNWWFWVIIVVFVLSLGVKSWPTDKFIEQSKQLDAMFPVVSDTETSKIKPQKTMLKQRNRLLEKS